MSPDDEAQRDEAQQQEAGDADLAAHPLTAARLGKVQDLRAAGVDPYPVRYDPDATASGIAEDHADLAPGDETGRRVSVAGRLVGFRDIGKLIRLCGRSTRPVGRGGRIDPPRTDPGNR